MGGGVLMMRPIYVNIHWSKSDPVAFADCLVSGSLFRSLFHDICVCSVLSVSGQASPLTYLTSRMARIN